MKPPTTNGWYGIPEQDYQYGEAYRYYLRNSGLKLMEQGRHYYWWAKNHPEPVDPFLLSSQARSQQRGQMFYSAIHSILTGAGREVIVLDYKDYRKGEAKLCYAESVNEYQGCVPVILADKYDEAIETANSVAAHPTAVSILNHPDAIFEQAGIFKIPNTDVLGMIKPDVRIPTPGRELIVDLKAVGKATPDHFVMQARKLGYDYQDYWYRYGAQLIDGVEYSFAFLCYETEEPYRCELFYFKDFGDTDEKYAVMQARVDKIVQDFNSCLKTDDWSQDLSHKGVKAPYRRA